MTATTPTPEGIKTRHDTGPVTKTYLEVFDLEVPGVEGVGRREDVTGWTEAQIAESARRFTDRIDRDFYGVRLAEVTVTVLRSF